MLLLAAVVVATVARAEPLRVGILKVGASGPLYIAQDRGYFAAEGLWYRTQGMVKGGITAEALIDRHDAVALP